ncbi:hypothetical protein VTH06DRAFT_1269 [Thermothelomyces fergusii]
MVPTEWYLAPDGTLFNGPDAPSELPGQSQQREPAAFDIRRDLASAAGIVRAANLGLKNHEYLRGGGEVDLESGRNLHMLSSAFVAMPARK